jgi:hypothetical protein
MAKLLKMMDCFPRECVADIKIGVPIRFLVMLRYAAHYPGEWAVSMSYIFPDLKNV